jgi:hypothetical protein
MEEGFEEEGGVGENGQIINIARGLEEVQEVARQRNRRQRGKDKGR